MHRTFLFIAKRSLALLISFPLTAAAEIDTTKCSLPEGWDSGTGHRLPVVAHTQPELSPDGRHLFFKPGHVLDLQSLQMFTPIVTADLSGEVFIGVVGPVWSPYDPEKLALTGMFYLDDYKDRRSHLFIYNLQDGQALKVTPAATGKLGPASIGVYGWLGTSPEHDTLLVGYNVEKNGPRFTGYYILPGETLVPAAIPIPPSNQTSSRTGKHVFYATYYLDTTKLYFDSVEFSLGPPDETKGKAVAFSTDEALVVFSVATLKNYWYDELWVYRTDDISQPVRRLNFQDLFCTYSLYGINPEFLTDSTLAVSMHKDGDLYSLLWEITIDGRIVRQLTFAPQAAVPRAEERIGSAWLWPSVITPETEINFEALPSRATLTLVDALGRIALTREIDAGQKSVRFNASEMNEGLYISQLVWNGGVRSGKVLVRR